MLMITGESNARFGRVLQSDDSETILFEAHVDQNRDQIRVPKEQVNLLIVNSYDFKRHFSRNGGQKSRQSR